MRKKPNLNGRLITVGAMMVLTVLWVSSNRAGAEAPKAGTPQEPSGSVEAAPVEESAPVPRSPVRTQAAAPKAVPDAAAQSPVRRSKVPASSLPEQHPEAARIGQPQQRAPILDTNSSKISFQALLTDGGGDPLADGPHTLDFFFYSTDVGGVPLGSVLNVVVTTTDGIADAQVGPLDPTWFDGSARYMGLTVDDIDDDPTGDELSPRIPMTAVPYAFRVDRVESEELTDNVWLGDGAGTYGTLDIASFDGTSSMFASGLNNRIDLFALGSSAIVRVRLAGGASGFVSVHEPGGGTAAYMDGDTASVGAEGSFDLMDSIGGDTASLFNISGGGRLEIWDELGTLTTRTGSSFTAGGLLELYQADGDMGVLVDGDATGADGGGNIWVQQIDGDSGVKIDGDSSGAGLVQVYDTAGSSAVNLDGSDSSVNAEGSLRVVDSIGGNTLARMSGPAGGGQFTYYDEFGATTALGGSSNVAGGFMQLYQADGDIGLILDGDRTGANTGGYISSRNSANNVTLILEGDEGDSGALLTMSDGAQITVDIDANAGGGGAGVILRNSAGVDTVVIDADSTDAGKITMRDEAGVATVVIETSEGGIGAQILLRNDAGSTTIQLDADWGGSGEGRVVTDVLEIQGGADLSEQFDVKAETRVEPGMVVCIDASHPGKLRLGAKPYDRSVAGIISGAGGVKPGMLMSQRGSEADGQYPVALTGRVYCWVDASNGPVVPGDLLTTSATPGHAMKVTDHERARGAIIGKAMTALPQGKGLVLVLVSLQ